MKGLVLLDQINLKFQTTVERILQVGGDVTHGRDSKGPEQMT